MADLPPPPPGAYLDVVHMGGVALGSTATYPHAFNRFLHRYVRIPDRPPVAPRRSSTRSTPADPRDPGPSSTCATCDGPLELWGVGTPLACWVHTYPADDTHPPLAPPIADNHSYVESISPPPAAPDPQVAGPAGLTPGPARGGREGRSAHPPAPASPTPHVEGWS